ncbi:MAG: hypothetical protein P4L85_19600 [Paludisphaera borealis]|uniref:hypothetical protein n=1 Tax=Paludisphaera borealis TaxID=1387353 RepID=UPI00284B8BA9|nr:hypothetical protein [Paludisphaera borealis]MDR3621566.1 hypothetical protein [Paludisphaera borealis]
MREFAFDFWHYGWPLTVRARLCTARKWDSEDRGILWCPARFGRWVIAVMVEFEAVPVRKNTAESVHHFLVGGHSVAVTVCDMPNAVWEARDRGPGWSVRNADGRTCAAKLVTDAPVPKVKPLEHRALATADR